MLSARHRGWLRQAVRTLVSMALSDVAAWLCGLHEAGWALITAAIVTSNSVTGTWTAGRDQIVGTLIGAAAGTAAIGLTLLGWPKLPVFALMLTPLALLAAALPTLRLTCVTLVVVFLFPSPGGAFERPFDRVVAILIGAATSLLVSYLVFRSRARASAFAAASAMLEALQTLLQEVLSGAGATRSRDSLSEIASSSLRALADAVLEARREHLGTLEAADPLLVRLVPMLRRLQSDVLFVTRAIDELPDAAASARLHPASLALGQVFEALRRRCAALAQDGTPPDRQAAAGEIDTLDHTLASLGDTAGVPIRFTLQMLRRDLDDVEAALEQDHAERSGATVASRAEA